MVMNDIRDHYAELLDLSDSLLDNLAGLIERMPPPETCKVNWGHIGKLLDFNRQLSEASYDLHKHIDFWNRKELENADWSLRSQDCIFPPCLRNRIDDNDIAGHT